MPWSRPVKTRHGIRQLTNRARLALLALSFSATMVRSEPALAQKFVELAKTPPLGWNSWNRFGCNIDEKTVMRQADAMVSSGLKAAGYRYIVIDDCWHGERDQNGFIQPHAQHFPNGKPSPGA